jgi:AmmeMemoRadiSam system protein B
MSDSRTPAVAGTFYPANPVELRQLVGGLLADVDAEPQPAVAAIAPHAGLIYSGACAAHVFKRVAVPPVVVILAPNHSGLWENIGGAAAWSRGEYGTPAGTHPVAAEFFVRLERECQLVAHDPVAHLREHAVEVELPFLSVLAPNASVAPIVLAWDDWNRCQELATALATVVAESDENVLLLASSDMSHYESANSAARKDSLALESVQRLDGEELLATCRRESVSMCGRAPAATVIEAAQQLGATQAEVVDYRNSGMVTGDDSSVVAYAGVVVH